MKPFNSIHSKVLAAKRAAAKKAAVRKTTTKKAYKKAISEKKLKTLADAYRFVYGKKK